MKDYRAGAVFGALGALLVYMTVPIYSDSGPASILPTGNVALSSAAYDKYISNLPFSVFIGLGLVILGIAAGIIAQIILRKATQ